jgi:hypothetical protein
MGKLNTVQNGKGSKSRISDLTKYENGYDAIDWGRENNTSNMKTINLCRGGVILANEGQITDQSVVNGSLYTRMKDGTVYVEAPLSTEPLKFVNSVIDENGNMVPAPWSVCNLPPEEFNKPYTITTCDGNGKVEVREVKKDSSITH